MSERECVECGNDFRPETHIERCEVCGATVDATPNDELRELVEQWRERADAPLEGRLDHVDMCAGDLEDLLNE